jgi:tetratricopeptide (TPR) repeat protein
MEDPMHCDPALQNTITKYEDYLQADADNVLLLIELGHLYEVAGQVQQAQRCYQRCLELEPANRPAQTQLACLLLQEKHYAKAEKGLRELLATGEPDALLVHLLGVALYSQHQFAEAAECFARAAEREPVAPANLASWARALHAQGKLAEALVIGERLLAASPSDAYHGYVALLHLESDNGKRADELARAALQRHPGDSAAHTVIGSLALERREFDAALSHFGQALGPRQDNDNARAWLGLGLAHLGEQRPALAIEALERAVRAFPDNPGNRVTLGWAKVLAQDFIGAEQAFRQAIEANAAFGESHGGLATALALQGERASAEDVIKRARRLAPAGFGAELATAILLAHNGNTAAASAHIERALRRLPPEQRAPLANALRRQLAAESTNTSSGPLH